MTMQTDVQSAYVDATGDVYPQRTRVRGVYVYCGASAGVLELKDGSGGSTRFKIATPAAATSNPVYIPFPGEGILFQSAVYATLTNVGAVTVFYG